MMEQEPGVIRVEALSLTGNKLDQEEAWTVDGEEIGQLGDRLYKFLRGESDEPPEALLAKDFTGHLTEGLPQQLGGDYAGREDMMNRGWGRVGRAFDIHPEVETIYAVGENLLVARGHYVGTAIPTGRPVRAAFAHFWGIRDQRFVSVYQVTDSAAWEHALYQ